MKRISKAEIVLEQLICDSCGMNATDRETEAQEFLSFSDTAGYGNEVFGDGTQWSIDLCQYCIKNLLGDYIQIKGNVFR